VIRCDAIAGRGERDPPELLRAAEVAYVRPLERYAGALAEAAMEAVRRLAEADDEPTRTKVRTAMAAAIRAARTELSPREAAEVAADQWDRITSLSSRVASRHLVAPTTDDVRADETREQIAKAKARAEKRISGGMRKRFLAEQDRLYTSLSVEFAGKLADELDDAIARGRGWDALVGIVERLGSQVETRAVLIAENETQRWFGEQQQIRYSEAGLDSYVWRTQRDSRVRPLHASYEGETFRWSESVKDAPPGSSPNCRCWAEPVVTWRRE
jgi:SPP1 gp7 family putative phage head morphogenesis protein